MNKANKDSYKQIKARKQQEYDSIYNSLYKKIFIGICFVVMLVISFGGFEDEIIAYVIGVLIIIVFNLIWSIIQKKRINNNK